MLRSLWGPALVANSKSTHPAGAFRAGFERIASAVAVDQSADWRGTLQKVVAHTIVVLSSDSFTRPEQLVKAIATLFGVSIPLHQVQSAIDLSLNSGRLRKSPQGRLAVPEPTRGQILAAIEAGATLEERVRGAWSQQVPHAAAGLDAARLWSALQAYLTAAFRRHGMQTVALLDPTYDVPAEHARSLTSLLHEAVSEHFEGKDVPPARDAVSAFLATAGSDPERARYISQLADGAFNYFALAVDPAAADALRSHMRDLRLFLDTNVLFGLLELHASPHVAVSRALVSVIREQGFPIGLRYHEATEREMERTITWYAAVLKKCEWTRALSRAATESRRLSGVELRYHELNAQQKTDVDAFFRPYAHMDQLLRVHGIEIYRPTAPRLEERATLHAEYEEFLRGRGKARKGYELIEHDATVLDAVRALRRVGKSSLDAGALLVTCDYSLYRFDWEQSRARKASSCTVLPNMLWQLLRPMIRTDGDFDRGFAETFALPEFRTMGSAVAKAASLLMGILGSYGELPPETATAMLANDLLLQRLETTSESEARQIVESELADRNIELMEEKAAAEREHQRLREELAARDAKLREAEAALSGTCQRL